MASLKQQSKVNLFFEKKWESDIFTTKVVNIPIHSQTVFAYSKVSNSL